MNAPTVMPSDSVRLLPNSAYLVDTAAGAVLVNCPPETLKYLLAQGLEPPQIVLILPDVPPGQQLGSSGFVRHGINYASVEFIAYGNFFGHGRRTTIITATRQQARRIDQILEETVNGPDDPADYGAFAWVQQECAAVGHYPPLGRLLVPEDLVLLKSLEEGGGDLGQGVTIHLAGDQLIFREQGEMTAALPATVTKPARPLMVAPPRPLLRHELTLQFIGGSDGFDPSGITTCFLAYVCDSDQESPILFDAAAYLTIRLGNLGISPGQISELVLSHVHEDHLAGLPELLLLGGKRLRLITSDLVYLSLLRVLSAMLDIPQADVAALFDFYPLNPGQPLLLNGRRFEAIYAVHSIPTIAARVNDLYYSGDMRYDETWFDELVDQGVLTPARRAELVNFADGAKVLVQDAGGGPVHTTITPEVLQALAAKGQRLILAHTREGGVTAVEEELPDSVEIAVSGAVSGVGRAFLPADEARRLETLSVCPLFARLPARMRWQLAQAAQLFTWEDGATIIKNGEPSDGWAYVVHAGLVDIREDGELLLTLGRGRSVGERGALQGTPRTNTLLARGRVQLLGLDADLLAPVDEYLGLWAAFNRADWLWEQPLFHTLPWSTLLDLALDLQPRLLAAGETLFYVGEPGYDCYLLVSGAVKIMAEDGRLLNEINNPGNFFCGRAALFNTLRNASARAAAPTEVWAFSAADLQRWQMVYPQLLLHLRLVESQRLGHTPGAP
jgi:CRP-like cAMP-binding protein